MDYLELIIERLQT